MSYFRRLSNILQLSQVKLPQALLYNLGISQLLPDLFWILHSAVHSCTVCLCDAANNGQFALADIRWVLPVVMWQWLVDPIDFMTRTISEPENW
jgi:hypothetical protein